FGGKMDDFVAAGEDAGGIEIEISKSEGARKRRGRARCRTGFNHYLPQCTEQSALVAHYSKAFFGGIGHCLETTGKSKRLKIPPIPKYEISNRATIMYRYCRFRV